MLTSWRLGTNPEAPSGAVELKSVFGCLIRLAPHQLDEAIVLRTESISTLVETRILVVVVVVVIPLHVMIITMRRLKSCKFKYSWILTCLISSIRTYTQLSKTCWCPPARPSKCVINSVPNQVPEIYNDEEKWGILRRMREGNNFHLVAPTRIVGATVPPLDCCKEGQRENFSPCRRAAKVSMETALRYFADYLSKLILNI